MNTPQLRQDLRRRRQSLSRDEQRKASLAVAASVLSLHHFARANSVVAYVGSKGEIDPMPLLHIAHQMGKQCYLPVLHPFLSGRLWFVPWTPQTPMQLNRFNIPEPVFDVADVRKPQWIDVIITPLLGFDANCHRLGMGGGYYDRTLARTQILSRWNRPLLIGIAHEEQRCEQLPIMPWDIRLDRIITPARLYQCDNKQL